ncbi:MAG TPA: OsmC family protein [Streptosporangiaceae bacterium]|nr:OsmC family protein [Streptosporangiaceae bacterium]
MSSTPATSLNQVDVTDLKAYIGEASAAPELADRQPQVIARWVGDSRARITINEVSMHLGGGGELNPMQALLGSLAACDVDVVATHASLLGIEITELWVEASGRFHVARYLGLDSEQPPGYQHIDYTVHLRVRQATEEQIARLRRQCETGSPVGDTLTRPVPATLTLDVRPG